MGVHLSDGLVSFGDQFDDLQAKKRVLVAKETLREMRDHTLEKILEHPNYRRRAERLKYGHNLSDLASEPET